jgi:hypothetical protein
MNSIAVVRARLPYIDHRSLSEAWFSSLHLARDRGSATAGRARPDVAVFPLRVEWFARQPVAAGRGGAMGRPRSSECAPVARREGGAHSAGQVCHGWQTAGEVEAGPLRRRALARTRPGTRASFSIALAEGGRVQILLRREGRTLHVIALCSARHVELVRRALACADLHLRMSGERVASEVRAL